MMITKNGKNAKILNGHELLYNTSECKDLHKITDDLYIIEEEKALVLVYCSTLITRLDNLIFYKIIPKYGVFIYENIMRRVLGVFYTGHMERLSWFIQEEDYLIFMPQGRWNILNKNYIVHGFNKNGHLVLENKKGIMGCWNPELRKFIKGTTEIEQSISDF